MEGINAEQSDSVVVTDDKHSYAEACLAYFTGRSSADVSNRQWILGNFTWQQTLEPLIQYFSTEEFSN